MLRDKAYIEDILIMAKDAVSFIEGLSKEDFSKDLKTQYAVIRCLEVIGEAAKKVSDKTKMKYDIPWPQIAKMRDLLIHSYGKVDYTEVWITAKNDLPELIRILESK
ncbi:DUF86 domain-containing protein [Methanoplanus sp. FWC-SCC4]|uniref:DUF86 domain-containing protein n=1 Tax=Methanochimaera problematica TaxID=2609417 RepID=A0AA97FC75_9EURY|nr:DUF86 domain-containing protein [Methanoplanus sp. FWC-SCC4]WOF16795.1 DUF86 domain-containing protein [Methanoplanus sp. FWC-SCC4]